MAKKSKTKPAKENASAGGNVTEQFEHAIACEFGGVSGNKESAKIGVSIDASNCTLPKMAKLFKHSQLQMRLTATLNGDNDDPNQQMLPMGEPSEEGDLSTISTTVIAEVSGFRVGPHNYSLSLCMNDEAVNIDMLWRFRAKPGVMHLNVMGKPEPKHKGAGAVDDGEEIDGGGE